MISTLRSEVDDGGEGAKKNAVGEIRSMERRIVMLGKIYYNQYIQSMAYEEYDINSHVTILLSIALWLLLYMYASVYIHGDANIYNFFLFIISHFLNRSFFLWRMALISRGLSLLRECALFLILIVLILPYGFSHQFSGNFRLLFFKYELGASDKRAQHLKVEENYHILDFVSIKCNDPRVVTLILNPSGFLLSLSSKMSDRRMNIRKKSASQCVAVDMMVPRSGNIVASMRQAFRRATCGMVPLPMEMGGKKFGCDAVPMDADDFTDVYKAISDYMKLPISKSVLYLITFLTDFGSGEFDFELISEKLDDLVKSPAIPLAVAMRYNNFFTRIVFSEGVASHLFNSLRHNRAITSLSASNLLSGSLGEFGSALQFNPSNVIQVKFYEVRH